MSFSERLKTLRQRLGYVPRRKGRAVLVLGDSDPAFAAAGPVLEALGARHPRLNVFLVARDPALRARLATRRPRENVLPKPFSAALPTRLYLARSKAAVVLLGEGGRTLERRFVERVAEAGAAIALLGAPEGTPAWLNLVDLFFVQDSAQADRLRRAGVSPERVRWPNGVDRPEAGIAEALEPLIVRERRAPGAVFLTYRQLRERLPGVVSDAGLLALKYRRIPTIEALAEALGRPAGIVCLGNGPSSEDPRLAAFAGDTLFRVNHAWLGRGFMTGARMVFTGSKATVRALKGPLIFGFQTRQSEQRMRLKCLTVPRRVTYATAERLGAVDFGRFGKIGPTNGAVMVATAVALRPRRLVIAGIDLFSHPAGSYPGDASTPNAYTPGHDRATELGFILATLERYDGELVILGEILDTAWREHCARRRAGLHVHRQDVR